jgi:hypothetical protein
MVRAITAHYSSHVASGNDSDLFIREWLASASGTAILLGAADDMVIYILRNDLLERHMRLLEDNIKIDLRDVEPNDVACVLLFQDKFRWFTQWQALQSTNIIRTSATVFM